MEEPSPAGDFFVGTRPVYAHLVNERGGSWVFTTVNNYTLIYSIEQ